MSVVQITNLPAATTPLIGTEALVIQQNGITAQVAVNNLPTSGLPSIPAFSTLANLTASSTQPTSAQQLILGTPFAITGNLTPFQATGTITGAYEMILQNLSNNSSASTDFIATANDGSDTAHYIDLGINSSGGGATPFTNPHAAYLYSTEAELDIGAIGASGVINFYSGPTPTLLGSMTATGLNGMAIGATTASAGTFTTLAASSLAVSSINGTPIGNTTPSTGAFTTLSVSSTVGGAGITSLFASPPAIGGTAPAAGSFTTLSAAGTVSGSGITSLFASPPAIGGTAAAAGSFTSLSASGTVSGIGFSTYLASPPAIGGTAPAAANFTTVTASGRIDATAGIRLGLIAAISVAGDIWQDSTQQSMGNYQAGLATYLSSLIYSAKATVTTSGTTAVSLFSGTAVGTLTLPANFFVAGKTVRLGVYGTVTAQATAGTTIFTLALGGTTVAASTSATTVSTGTSLAFGMEIDITCYQTGTTATVIANTKNGIVGSTGVAALGTLLPVSTAAANVNTAASQAITLTSTNSVSGGTVFTVTGATIEVVG